MSRSEILRTASYLHSLGQSRFIDLYSSEMYLRIIPVTNEMLFAVKRAVELYNNKKDWRSMVKRIMNLDTSWSKSAVQYKELYEQIV